MSCALYYKIAVFALDSFDFALNCKSIKTSVCVSLYQGWYGETTRE